MLTATHLMAAPLAPLKVDPLALQKVALRKAATLPMLLIILWGGVSLTARQMRA
jgi:hypothetical protein